MRSISIQIQPDRAPGIDMQAIRRTFAQIAAMTDLVGHEAFADGHDRRPYVNFTFGTRSPAQLWRVIQDRVYEDGKIGPYVKAASIAMCSDEHGWDRYLLLYHFDPAVPCDSLSDLTS